MRKLAIACTLLLLILVGGFVAAQYFINKLANDKIAATLSRMEDKAEVAYQDVGVDLFSQSLIMEDIAVRFKDGRHFTAKRLVVREYDLENPRRPQHADVTLEGVAAPVTPENFGEETEKIRELGVETIHADVRVNYTLSPDKRGVALEPLEVTVQDIGAFKLVTHLEHIDQHALKNFELGDLAVRKLHLVYEDVQFLQAIMRSTRDDEPELTRFLAEGLAEEIAMAKAEGRDKAAASLEVLAAYVEEPGQLSVDVVLDEPMRAADVLTMRKITNIIKLFTISITQA